MQNGIDRFQKGGVAFVFQDIPAQSEAPGSVDEFTRLMKRKQEDRVRGKSFLIACAAVIPSTKGIDTSRMIRSGCNRSVCSIASWPFAASPTTSTAEHSASTERTALLMTSRSSATSTRLCSTPKI